MADDQNSVMDYEEHDGTYAFFMYATKILTCTVLGILVCLIMGYFGGGVGFFFSIAFLIAFLIAGIGGLFIGEPAVIPNGILFVISVLVGILMVAT